jgi:hypothetical protein
MRYIKALPNSVKKSSPLFWNGGGSTMIAKHLDRRTVAAMELALEKACEHLPSGGTHDLRKRVARAVIRCAQTGNCTLDALVEAGQSALERLPRHKGANVRTDRPDAA